MKFKNAVDHANELLAENAALEARVKELEADNAILREQRAGLAREANTFETELARLKAEPRPAAPEEWEACSPEWIERNGPCSCSEAPRIAFGEIGSHYHPKFFASGQPQRIVVKLPEEHGTFFMGGVGVRVFSEPSIIEAIRAAGGEIVE